MKVFFSLLFCCFLWSAPANATKVLTISEEYQSFFDFSLEILEDTDNVFSAEQVMASTGWQDGTNSISKGYSRSAFWFRFQVNNTAAQLKVMNLLFTETVVTHIELYQQTSSGWNVTRSGVDVSIEQRVLETQYPVFALEFGPNSDNIILLKIQSPFGIFGAFQLLEQEELFTELLLKDSVHMFMLGAVLVITLYNLSLWFSLKERVYLYYVAYASGYWLWLTFYSGHYLFFFPLSLYTEFNIIVAIVLSFLILFSQAIFNSGNTLPRMHRLLNGILLMLALSITLSVSGYHYIGFQIQNIISVVLMPVLFAYGILAIRTKLANAKTYTVALLFYYAGIIVIGLMALGMLPYNDVIRNAQFPGTLLELVLFSFLLANRVNTDRQVALEAKSKLLVIEQEANQMLEQKVEERTQEISQQKKQLEMLAITDSLTGLYNRRGFGDHFERCFQRRSQQAPLCMVMLDIDYFKNYNDYYGHQKGDEVLESVGHLLTRQFSYSGSEAFRLGGEEFALLFHGQLSEAVDVAEQCRQAVYDLGIAHQASDIGLVTASFGVIVIDESDDFSSSEIYKLADDALYQSKRTGRNRISVWSPEEAATNESVCKVR